MQSMNKQFVNSMQRYSQVWYCWYNWFFTFFLLYFIYNIKKMPHLSLQSREDPAEQTMTSSFTKDAKGKLSLCTRLDPHSFLQCLYLNRKFSIFPSWVCSLSYNIINFFTHQFHCRDLRTKWNQKPLHTESKKQEQSHKQNPHLNPVI